MFNYLLLLSAVVLLKINPAIAKDALQEQFLISEIQQAIVHDFALQADQQELKVKEPTVGEQKVADALEKNRASLKAKQQAILEQNKKSLSNRQKDSSSSNMIDKVNQWQTQKINQYAVWTETQRQLVDRWEKDKLDLVKRIPLYKQNSFDLQKTIQAEAPVLKKIPKLSGELKDLPLVLFSDSFMIDQAFSFPVKDQGQRPTCAAFAGVRAMEIILAQQGISSRLSEQFFYYLSLPNCQRQSCNKQGSWILNAYQGKDYIPKLSECPYSITPLLDNTTQIPLDDRCYRGVAKVQDFYRVSDFKQVIEALRRNMPVVGAFKLSSDFYHNNGHVFLSGPKDSKSTLDSHAAGHALVLVGMMGLPEALRAKEGDYCLLVANSWGEGWGKGGHACLSQRWLEKFRYPVDFIALKSVVWK